MSEIDLNALAYSATGDGDQEFAGRIPFPFAAIDDPKFAFDLETLAGLADIETGLTRFRHRREKQSVPVVAFREEQPTGLVLRDSFRFAVLMVAPYDPQLPGQVALRGSFDPYPLYKPAPALPTPKARLVRFAGIF